MKKLYESPEAEVLSFTALEDVAVVNKDEEIGKDPTVEFVSREF